MNYPKRTSLWKSCAVLSSGAVFTRRGQRCSVLPLPCTCHPGPGHPSTPPHPSRQPLRWKLLPADRASINIMPHLLTGHHLSSIVQPEKPSRGIATTGRIMHWPGKKSKKKTWWGQGWGDRRRVGSVAWPCRVPAGLQWVRKLPPPKLVQCQS